MGDHSIQWGGFDDSIIQGEYVASLGTAPGNITLTIVTPENEFDPPDVSNVVFSDGINEIVVKDCRITNIQRQVSTSGFKKIVTLEDSRWKWRFGFILGTHNVINADQTVDITTEASVSALVSFLFIAMGHTGKTEGLPDIEPDARPFVNWDYARPAEELEKLLDKFGRSISYAPDGTVAIVEIGKSTTSPDKSDAQELPKNKAVVIKPTSLFFISGYNLRQGDFTLEAVAIDSDDTVKALKDVSWFSSEAQGNDIHYLLGIDNKDDRNRARKSLFRYYRMRPDLDWDIFRNPTDPLGVVPEYIKEELGIKVWTLDKVLPLPAKIVQAGENADKNAEERGSLVVGEYYDVENNFTTVRDTGKNWPRTKASWNLDVKTGLIIFNNPVFKRDASNNMIAAVLYLRTAVQPYRNRFRRKIGGPGDTNEIVVDDTLFLRAVDGIITDNSVPVLDQMFERLDAQESLYNNEEEQSTIKLAGLKPVLLDGVVRQVTITVSTSSGSNTTYSQNTEHEHTVPTLEERIAWSKFRNKLKDSLNERGTSE